MKEPPKEKSMIEEWEIELFEKEWLESQPYISEQEWLEVFPESRSYLKKRLEKLKKVIEFLASEIQKDLEGIYKNVKDEFAVWFNEEIVRVWKGQTLNWIDKESRKLEWLLFPKEIKGLITEDQIQRAREYPLPELLGLSIKPKQMIKCPFHSEKSASFWITQNNDGTWFAYCFGGCGWHGDSIKFVMEKENLGFKEAIGRLT